VVCVGSSGVRLWSCDVVCDLRFAIEWSVFEVSWWDVGCDSGDGGDVMRRESGSCAGVFERAADRCVVWYCGIAKLRR
jgi:hypothetical protein